MSMRFLFDCGYQLQRDEAKTQKNAIPEIRDGEP